jgi:alkaline phosphatase D
VSSLRTPGLGPIVGHTTDRTCRLWIRAGDPEDAGAELSSERRTLGVVSVLEKNRKKLGENAPIYYFRLHREFDRTGTFTLGADVDMGNEPPARPGDHPFRLEPDCDYRARIGTLTIDDPFRNDKMLTDATLRQRLPDATSWRSDLEKLNGRKSDAIFRTLPTAGKPADRLTFLLGSCRYPGLLWKIKHADRIFGPMLEQATNNRGAARPSLALMVGDQIYADMLSRHIPIGLADTYEEFQERYLTAFGSHNMRQLLRRLPTYMILDDHEIEDNWTQDRLQQRSKRVLFNIAINAYMSYQWIHGPRNYGRRLYYDFAAAGYPFFVLDTRTQRFKSDDEEELSDNHLLGRPAIDPAEPGQLGRMLTWLERQQRDVKDAPKFIVSSSVFVPNAMSERTGSPKRRLNRSDSWAAFPTTRRAILEWITAKGIQNVVFLSGDIHCSNVARLAFKGAPEVERLKAFSITSSAFYWPFPFADGEPSDYVHDSARPGQADSFAFGEGLTMDYQAENFVQEDNFCRIEIDRPKHRIVVRVFGSDGEPVKKDRNVVSRLTLAPW